MTTDKGSWQCCWCYTGRPRHGWIETEGGTYCRYACYHNANRKVNSFFTPEKTARIEPETFSDDELSRIADACCIANNILRSACQDDIAEAYEELRRKASRMLTAREES